MLNYEEKHIVLYDPKDNLYFHCDTGYYGPGCLFPYHKIGFCTLPALAKMFTDKQFAEQWLEVLVAIRNNDTEREMIAGSEDDLDRLDRLVTKEVVISTSYLVR